VRGGPQAAPREDEGIALAAVFAAGRGRRRGGPGDEGAGVGAVFSPLYPAPKTEGWWNVMGQTGANSILAIKRVALGREPLTVQLEFAAPASAPGAEQLVKAQLLLISDSYLGVDQEYAFEMLVEPPGAAAAEEDATLR
jgi:hypothetical protein